jgi:hypothetical protein
MGNSRRFSNPPNSGRELCKYSGVINKLQSEALKWYLEYQSVAVPAKSKEFL